MVCFPGPKIMYLLTIAMLLLTDLQNKMAAILQTTLLNAFFVNEKVQIAIKTSLEFVPKGQINKILELLQMMTWRHPGDKPLSEAMLVSLPTQICAAWSECVKLTVGKRP